VVSRQFSVRSGPEMAECGPRVSMRPLVVSIAASIHVCGAIDLTQQHVFDRGDELAGGQKLHDESGGAGSYQGGRELRIRVERQDDNLGARAFEPRQSLDAVHARHGDVGHDNVWMQPSRGVDELLAVGNGGDHVEPIREQVDETVQHERVVVCDDYSRLVHHGQGNQVIYGDLRIVRDPATCFNPARDNRLSGCGNDFPG
jgi:hypothetical protein